MPDPVSFTSASPRFSLPMLFPGQAQKEFFVNEANARIDALLHPVIEGEAANPPAIPAEGKCWLVGGSPTGDWTGHGGDFACYTAGTWLFTEVREGLRVLDRSAGQFRLFRAGGWTMAETPTLPDGGEIVDVQARAAIAQLIEALAAAGTLPD